jgi:hypothetical protein
VVWRKTLQKTSRILWYEKENFSDGSKERYHFPYHSYNRQKYSLFYHVVLLMSLSAIINIYFRDSILRVLNSLQTRCFVLYFGKWRQFY